jgi:hypothetical protein
LTERISRLLDLLLGFITSTFDVELGHDHHGILLTKSQTEEVVSLPSQKYPGSLVL